MKGFVLFLDLLGTKAMVLPAEDDIDETNSVKFYFDDFHRILDAKIERNERFDDSHLHQVHTWRNVESINQTLNTIRFSDSIFVFSVDLLKIISFISECMLDFYRYNIPVRGGLAYGDFQKIKFSSDYSDDVVHQNAQFFGSGVVRAVESESSGKGMRVFVSSSVDNYINIAPFYFVPVIEKNNKCNYEINYLLGKKKDDLEGTFSSYSETVKSLKEESPNIKSVQLQYSRTIKALKRMLDHSLLF